MSPFCFCCSRGAIRPPTGIRRGPRHTDGLGDLHPKRTALAGSGLRNTAAGSWVGGTATPAAGWRRPHDAAEHLVTPTPNQPLPAYETTICASPADGVPLLAYRLFWLGDEDQGIWHLGYSYPPDQPRYRQAA